jgi:hypothetical protein
LGRRCIGAAQTYTDQLHTYNINSLKRDYSPFQKASESTLVKHKKQQQKQTKNKQTKLSLMFTRYFDGIIHCMLIKFMLLLFVRLWVNLNSHDNVCAKMAVLDKLLYLDLRPPIIMIKANLVMNLILHH